MAVSGNNYKTIIPADTNLAPFHTFRTLNEALQIVSFTNKDELIQLIDQAFQTNEKYLILGAGSNVLFVNDFHGNILIDRSTGINVIDEDDRHVFLRISSGVDWHSLVSHCVEKNYGGIENLALIPGKAGAAPIQNIGAYGVELADVLVCVTYYELPGFTIHTIERTACKFSYRNSIFKEMKRGSFWISSIVLKLTKKNHVLQVSYDALSRYFSEKKVNRFSIQSIFEAVVNIRKSKLPDPSIIGNAGSFFKNPVIPFEKYEQLNLSFPGLPGWVVSEDKIKIPAAWLIDKLGFKGVRIGDAGVHEKHALVLVNYGNAKGKEILSLANSITATVKKHYGIELESEVNIIY